MTDAQTLIFKTNRETTIGLAIVFWPIAALGIAAAFDGAWIEGPIVALVSVGVWLWYATLVVEFSPTYLIVRRIGRVFWSASRESAHAHFGPGGERKTHTALIIESSEQAKPVQILKVNFGADQLGRMARILGVRAQVPGGIF